MEKNEFDSFMSAISFANSIGDGETAHRILNEAYSRTSWMVSGLIHNLKRDDWPILVNAMEKACQYMRSQMNENELKITDAIKSGTQVVVVRFAKDLGAEQE